MVMYPFVSLPPYSENLVDVPSCKIICVKKKKKKLVAIARAVQSGIIGIVGRFPSKS
jgi:hypothetical protein